MPTPDAKEPWLDLVPVAPTQSRRALIQLAVIAVVLTLCFAGPLIDLVRLAVKSDLFSHVLLIPFVSLYLVWPRRSALRTMVASASWWAIVPGLLGVSLLVVYWTALRPHEPLPRNDYLCLTITAYLLLLLSGAWACLGTATVRAVAFPLGFLVFMIPWPTVLIDGIEIGLQRASAEAAHLMIAISGTPYLREGQTFHLPGIAIRVAQECSGVRSSYVLLITSVLGAHLLLRTRWKRWFLALAVIPLGIVRNGFRILTISMLCVHVSPDMIDSPLHHRGGPIFFVLSLIPFFLLLIWLRKTEGRNAQAGDQRRLTSAATDVV